MSTTMIAKIAMHSGLLARIQDNTNGSGAATLKIFEDEDLLVSIPIDHTTSYVDGNTGNLVLVGLGSGGTAVASGFATAAALVARDGAVLEDAIEVEAGTVVVPNKVVLDSLTITSGQLLAINAFSMTWV